MTTLADKVYNVTDANGATEYANSPTPPENREAISLDACRDMTEYEMQVRDWGVYFGVAYGIARSEDPFESADQVGERAFAAAEEAWTRAHVPDPVPLIGQIFRGRPRLLPALVIDHRRKAGGPGVRLCAIAQSRPLPGDRRRSTIRARSQPHRHGQRNLDAAARARVIRK